MLKALKIITQVNGDIVKNKYGIEEGVKLKQKLWISLKFSAVQATR